MLALIDYRLGGTNFHHVIVTLRISLLTYFTTLRVFAKGYFRNNRSKDKYILDLMW